MIGVERGMRRSALDYFGEVLMKKVRDPAISQWEGIIDGRMKSASAQRVHDALAGLNPEQMEVLRSLVPQIVDTTLHHLLWTLEQNENIDVAVKTPTESVKSIRDVSDGLSGEVYGDDGWISSYSKKPYIEP